MHRNSAKLWKGFPAWCPPPGKLVIFNPIYIYMYHPLIILKSIVNKQQIRKGVELESIIEFNAHEYPI